MEKIYKCDNCGHVMTVDEFDIEEFDGLFCTSCGEPLFDTNEQEECLGCHQVFDKCKIVEGMCGNCESREVAENE